MVNSIVQTGFSALSYANSIPGIYIATSAHIARKTNGPLEGMLTLAGTCAIAYKGSDTPLTSIGVGVALYFLPKAIEATVQQSFTNIALQTTKVIGSAALCVAVKTGSLTYSAVKSTTEKIYTVATQQSIAKAAKQPSTDTYALASISHKQSRQFVQDVAGNSSSNAREHSQIDKASAIEGEFAVTDCANCPRVCEKCGLEDKVKKLEAELRRVKRIHCDGPATRTRSKTTIK